MEQLVALLRQYGLSDEELGRIVGMGRSVNVRPNKVLVEAGERCDHAYFILKGGFVMQLIREEDGSERAVNFFLADFQPFMTVPQSFFRGLPSECRLLALCSSEVLAFHKEALLELVRDNPSFKEFYYAQIIEAFLAEEAYRLKLLSCTPQRMYAWMLAEHRTVLQNVPARHIASFMGITPEWLSNLKRKLLAAP